MPRPRSASAHQKVLDAALELIAEHGVEATSMDAIAGRSGVSKATIYKHWADKDALLLELMGALAGLNARPTFDSGDTRADMLAVLSYQPPEDNPMRQRTMPHFIGYSAHNQAFGETWRRTVTEPPRRDLSRLIARGISQGELPGDLDKERSMALLLGPMLYWHIFLRGKQETAKELAHMVVEAFWRAFGVSSHTAPARAKAASGNRRLQRS